MSDDDSDDSVNVEEYHPTAESEEESETDNEELSASEEVPSEEDESEDGMVSMCGICI